MIEEDDDRPSVADGHRTARRRSTVSGRAAAVWNPHAAILVFAGVVLVVMGVRLYRSALEVVYSDFTSRSTEGLDEFDAAAPDAADELITMQVEWTVGPLLIAFGIAAMLLGVLVLAARWRRTGR